MKKQWITIVLGVMVLIMTTFALLVWRAHPIPSHAFFANTQRPLVIAHRGGKGLYPEETLYALQQSANMGVDVLEMDVHSSADGVLVLMHNDTVDETTNGTGNVNALTLDELQTLDAGYHWTDDGGETYPYRGQGITVATLEEVFTALPTMRMNIEIKQQEPPIAAAVCDLIEQYGMTDRVLIASFSPKVMAAFRQECPLVAVSGGAEEIRTFYVLHQLLLTNTFTPKSHAYQVPEYHDKLHLLTPAFVEHARSRNIQVHAWTINEREDMQHMVNLGVDGIITDYPDRLLSVLGR
jgi:glycerophosphoryl diester phosphodiesterase